MEKLRFKDENGNKYPDLIIEQLKKSGTIISGGTPKTNVKEYWSGNNIWITPKDLSNLKNNYILNSERKISDLGIKKSSTRLIKKNSLILSCRAPIGYMAINKVEITTNQGCKSIYSDKLNSEYLMYFLIKNKQNLQKLGCGTTFKELSTKSLSNFLIKRPDLNEQNKIANYFSNLDTVINNKQRQLELMEKYKKDLLDKIFNQKIRFKDENGCDYPEWNPYKITEILKTVSNKKHSRDFDILSVTKDNGIVKRSDNGINIKASEKSIFQYKIVEINDYILHLESFRNGIDKSYIKGVCSPVYTILREKTENILLPILFKYSGFIHRINQLSTGIRQGKNISFSSMENLKINLPIIEEQEKIANLFSNLDLEINVLKNSIKNLKKFKIDMLEKMF